MEDKNKKIMTLLLVFTIIFTVIGSSFAYLRWQTSTEEQTDVTFTVANEFSCGADGGNELNSSSILLEPTTCDDSASAIKREITLKPVLDTTGISIYMDVWLDVVSLDDGLKNSDNFKWVLSNSPTSCSGSAIEAHGTFKGKVKDDKVLLLDGKTYTSTTNDKHYLYIWLDYVESSPTTMNQQFEFKLNGECEIVESNSSSGGPAAPTLDDGLIPVILSDDGTVTATTSSDPNWYDYENKQWANAVLVKENGVKTRIQNKVAGTEINPSDILAYFVWIPRYAYKIWTTDASTTTSPQEIMIEWESGDKAYTNGLQVGEYRTHAAFWWDENGNRTIDSGETLDGIWVGKFETSLDAMSETSVDEATPIIVDYARPFTIEYVDMERFFQVAMKFSGGTMTNNITSFVGNVTYGLTSNTNSHMMKNSEWGAVAYLSHSNKGLCQNGICEEIRINNYIDEEGYTMTGCGSEDCENYFGSGVSLYPQSTTGNITGIFDMSGGVYEYVMGIYSNYFGSSYDGFDSKWDDETSNKKYYDLYEIDYTEDCTIETCGGHALFETASWYDDYSYFVQSSYPWFVRGGGYDEGYYAGAFNFYSELGVASVVTAGFRSVLVQ